MLLVLLFVYLVGGLTFVPLVVFVLWRLGKSDNPDPDDTDTNASVAQNESEPLIPTNVTEKPLFTGWVTVTKEYFEYPSGDIPDKKDNPNAYTSLYKLANDTTPNEGDTGTVTQTPTQKPKPVKSRYFAELKLGNLFLYKSEERDLQLAIVLNDYRTQLYPELPDANLLAKRVAIRLTHVHKEDVHYYIFLENCSLKEDLYFRIIELTCQNSPKGTPLMFDHHDMINIIQKLHSSDENLHTAWFNAITARMFMSAYQTETLRGYFRNKIVQKLARVKRPAFLSEIQVSSIHVGNSVPFLTNPKLRELKPDGTLVVAAHLSYTGGYTIEITTKATFNFGQKLINIKPRPMTLVLRLTLSSMEGIVVFQVKPPPSTRIWWGFESMPEMNLKVEPVVSSRQITYSMVTNVIESKIRELVKESIVLPFTEDVNFFPSQKGNPFRGGLWKEHDDDEEGQEENEVVVDDDVSVMSSESEPTTMRHRTFRNAKTEEDFTPPSPPPSVMNLASAAASTSALNNPATQTDATPKSSNFMGAVKKWGAWYNEKKAEAAKKSKPAGGFASFNRAVTPATSPSLTADATVSLSSSSAAAITHRKPVAEKHAPQPHHFPPEMIDLINQEERKRKLSNPDQPIGMELPSTSPPGLPPRSNTASFDTDKSQFVKRKPVRSQTSVPNLRSVQSNNSLQASRDGVEAQEVVREPTVAPPVPPRSPQAGIPSKSGISGVPPIAIKSDRELSVVSFPVENGSPPKQGLVFASSHKASPLSAVQTPPSSNSPVVRVPRKPVGLGGPVVAQSQQVKQGGQAKSVEEPPVEGSQQFEEKDGPVDSPGGQTGQAEEVRQGKVGVTLRNGFSEEDDDESMENSNDAEKDETHAGKDEKHAERDETFLIEL